ncbi:nuclear transport factor 2 family protein [Mycobacterium sp. TY814]|uniref:nuclear transport factor 2 family protein n=1 Tax=unclassified Mycobacterium TaxID=2642494 RepID=UPI002740AB47|nr:nuclear transport factor 2 family protein [Mycobacterium sp. TY814]MDP7725031.1 nuclear transport factor 2 family protein [Mycobacterium sp. TY814]
MTTHTHSVAQRYVAAVNAFSIDAVMRTFAPDAVVNDNQREFATAAAIEGWVAAEIVGDRVTMEVLDTDDRSGLTVLRARYDGDFDKTGLPDELVLTNYIVARDDLITGLFIVVNRG